MHDLVHRHRAADRRALRDVLDHGVVVAPHRAVADDAGVDRVHADRAELDRERVDHAGHAAVDRSSPSSSPDRGGPSRGRRTAGSRRPRHLRQQRVDRLGVADELERDERERALEVVVAGGVRVAVDRDEDEVLDRPTSARRSAISFGCARSSASPRAPPPISSATCCAVASSRPVRTTSRPRPAKSRGDLAADAARAPDDDDASLGHRAPLRSFAGTVHSADLDSAGG